MLQGCKVTSSQPILAMFDDVEPNSPRFSPTPSCVADHNDGTNSETSPLFAMSGDGRDDIVIPILFLFQQQGARLVTALEESKHQLYMMLGYQTKPPGRWPPHTGSL